MKTFEALDLLLMLRILKEYRVECEIARRTPEDKDEAEDNKADLQELLKRIRDWLERAMDLFDQIGMGTAISKVNFLRGHLANDEELHDYSSLSADLRSVEDMIEHDLWFRHFIPVEEQYSRYVNNDKLFGGKVRRAFPRAVPDIRESGNCIAAGSGTAAVFHLMRAVEWSLRAFCRHLGFRQIPHSRKPGKKKKYIPIEYNQWEKMLGEASGPHRQKNRQDETWEKKTGGSAVLLSNSARV